MRLAEGITRHGFRKWYERELLRGHAHLAGAFICLVGVVGAFEALTRFRSWTDQAVDVAAILLFAGVGVWSLRRYVFHLGHAELVANQAECPSCGEYGRLRLVQAQPAQESVRVGCKKCAHEWSIEE